MVREIDGKGRFVLEGLYDGVNYVVVVQQGVVVVSEGYALVLGAVAVVGGTELSEVLRITAGVVLVGTHQVDEIEAGLRFVFITGCFDKRQQSPIILSAAWGAYAAVAKLGERVGNGVACAGFFLVGKPEGAVSCGFENSGYGLLFPPVCVNIAGVVCGQDPSQDLSCVCAGACHAVHHYKVAAVKALLKSGVGNFGIGYQAGMGTVVGLPYYQNDVMRVLRAKFVYLRHLGIVSQVVMVEDKVQVGETGLELGCGLEDIQRQAGKDGYGQQATCEGKLCDYRPAEESIYHECCRRCKG